MIKLQEIHKVYLQGKKGYHALKDATLYFEKGEIVAVYGPSGCGKTTLLNIIGGLDNPTSGHMVIGDRLTTQFTEKEWDHFRNHRIGFVFQSYNLIEHLPIVENVAISIKLSGEKPKIAKEKAIELLTKVGLEKHLEKLPGQLSGGERQRVAIARALINDPDIILADEPTGALDMKTGHEIMSLIRDISKDKLVIMVTHNKKIATEYSTRMIELKDGRVISDTAQKDKKVKIVNQKERAKGKLKFKEAIRLAYYNLIGKKWRTLLISFGLSVGIVGLILIDAFFSSIRIGLSQQEVVIKDNPDLYVETSPYYQESRANAENQLNGYGYFKDVLYSPEVTFPIVRNVTAEADLYNPIYGEMIALPENQDILNSFNTFVGDGRLPSADNEFALSESQAQRLISENSYLTMDELWDEVKNNEYLIYTSFNYVPFEETLSQAYLSGSCVVTGLHDENEGVLIAPDDYDELLLGDYNVNVLALREYTQDFITVGDRNEIYCVDYDELEWKLDPSSPSDEGITLTLVGIYDNSLFNEIVVTENTINLIEPQTPYIFSDDNDHISYRFRVFIDSDHIDDKVDIVKTLEMNDFWVYENFGNGFNLFEGVVNFFLYVLQFIFSSIIWIAIITGALMLLLILYISVLERKREIGIIRALGGTRKDVRVIYSGETTIIGLIAGIMSVILSIVIVLILNWYLERYQLDLILRYLPFMDPSRILVINFGKMALAILGSIVIALVSGLIPAHIASKKKPIEALRND
jgi:putative ABC transport system permease protein